MSLAKKKLCHHKVLIWQSICDIRRYGHVKDTGYFGLCYGKNTIVFIKTWIYTPKDLDFKYTSLRSSFWYRTFSGKSLLLVMMFFEGIVWCKYPWQFKIAIVTSTCRWLVTQEWSSFFVWINASYGRCIKIFCYYPFFVTT